MISQNLYKGTSAAQVCVTYNSSIGRVGKMLYLYLKRISMS